MFAMTASKAENKLLQTCTVMLAVVVPGVIILYCDISITIMIFAIETRRGGGGGS